MDESEALRAQNIALRRALVSTVKDLNAWMKDYGMKAQTEGVINDAVNTLVLNSSRQELKSARQK